MTIIRSTHQATAFPGSDALAPPGSVGQVSNRQAEPLLRRKDDLHVAYWNVPSLQDVGVQALTMRELRKYNVDIACLSEVRIPDSGHTLIKVPGGVALGLDVDARIRCTTYVAHWSIVGASNELL